MLMVIAVAAGCGRERDLGPRLSAEEVRSRLEARAEAIRSLRAECRIMISKRGRGAVELRGVLIADKANRLRLRAWKASQVAFDLTATPEGTWLLAEVESSRREQEGAESSIAEAQVSRAVDLLFGVPGGPLRATGKRDALVYEQPLRKGQGRARCELNRYTALLEGCAFVDSGGRSRAEVQFDGYRLVEGVALAHEIEFRAGGLRIEMEVTDLELNPQLSNAVFQPPADARPLQAS